MDFSPDAAAEIDRIALKVEAAGKPCKWGEKPNEDFINPSQIDLPLCFSCQAKHEAPEVTNSRMQFIARILALFFPISAFAKKLDLKREWVMMSAKALKAWAKYRAEGYVCVKVSLKIKDGDVK